MYDISIFNYILLASGVIYPNAGPNEMAIIPGNHSLSHYPPKNQAHYPMKWPFRTSMCCDCLYDMRSCLLMLIKAIAP
jgi:hypothetical protein